MEALWSVEDDWKGPMKLQTTSGHVSESSKAKDREDLPGRTKVEPGDLGCEADTSSAPWSIERVLKKPTKLRNTSEHVNKCSKRRTRKYSPGRAQVELGDPSSEADTSRASGRAEETREKSKKLQNVSEQVRERSEQRIEQDSPKRAQSGRAEPSREAGMTDDSQSHQERPRSFRNQHVNETNAPCRRNGPGGHLGEPEASRGVEGVRHCGKVVDGAEHNGIRPSSRGNEHKLETNAPCRAVEPGDHIGDREASREVKGNWSRESDGDGVGYHGRRDGKDGATSGARRDSKRVETRPLAGDKGQSQQVERDITTDVPEASTPPPNDPKRPVELPNPPRR